MIHIATVTGYKQLSGVRANAPGKNVIAYAIDPDAYNATEQTTDATATVVKSIPLCAGDAVYIEVVARAVKSDLSSDANYRYAGLFYRTASGNVTQAGSTTAIATDIETGGGVTWTLTMIANTTDQTVDITVTGEAATTIDWYVFVDTKKNESVARPT